MINIYCCLFFWPLRQTRTYSLFEFFSFIALCCNVKQVSLRISLRIPTIYHIFIQLYYLVFMTSNYSVYTVERFTTIHKVLRIFVFLLSFYLRSSLTTIILQTLSSQICLTIKKRFCNETTLHWENFKSVNKQIDKDELSKEEESPP